MQWSLAGTECGEENVETESLRKSGRRVYSYDDTYTSHRFV